MYAQQAVEVPEHISIHNLIHHPKFKHVNKRANEGKKPLQAKKKISFQKYFVRISTNEEWHQM